MKGPKGGPGMREMLAPTSSLAGMGLMRMWLLSPMVDSVAQTRGAPIGHISPEAAEGGPIALVKDGDLISIDMVECTITLKVSDEELTRRKTDWKVPEPKIKGGYLARYARMVTSASTGAVVK